MRITKKLAVAMLAGASGIRTNHRCDWARYILDPEGKDLEIDYADAADELIRAAAEVLGLKLREKEKE